jgi:uncharacterized protein YajQ (UPF0234 family)
MPSFDVVSKLDWSEVANAMQQAQKELSQRYDFRGKDARIEEERPLIWIFAKGEDRVAAAWQVFQEKLLRRKVSTLYFDAGDPEPGPKGDHKLKITVKEGIDQDNAKTIVRAIKDSKLKVQAAIMAGELRITGKKRDDLQAAMAQIRATSGLTVDLQFTNFRD